VGAAIARVIERARSAGADAVVAQAGAFVAELAAAVVGVVKA
jgi:hypothetical protein